MIRIERLCKRYGRVEALREISIDISPEEVLAVVGPSGCGKTTLLRLVAGFDIPDEGSIAIDGTVCSTPAHHVAPPHTRGLSMIFQDLALWPHMTAFQHVAFIVKRKTSSRAALLSEVQNILADVSLNGHGNRYPHQLSGGERQRLAIARALASRPRYLLMDEPFSNLDPLLKGEMRELLRGIRQQQKMGLLYVTHDVQEIHTVADRIAVMREGRLEQIGPIQEVLDAPANPFVQRFLQIDRCVI
jgi:ABC-type Fe3+/spermidine/putrescine transport system ATPase subunit